MMDSSSGTLVRTSSERVVMLAGSPQTEFVGGKGHSDIAAEWEDD
jgi:hypothetical protein